MCADDRTQAWRGATSHNRYLIWGGTEVLATPMPPAGDLSFLRPRQSLEAHCGSCLNLQQQVADLQRQLDTERAANLATIQQVYGIARSDGSEQERRRLGLPAGAAVRRVRIPRLRG